MSPAADLPLVPAGEYSDNLTSSTSDNRDPLSYISAHRVFAFPAFDNFRASIRSPVRRDEPARREP
jgi:hypothetical protein